MDIKFYENLLFRLRERRAIVSDRLLAGVFESFDEYKLSVGKFKGLSDAEIIVKQLHTDMYGMDMEKEMYSE